MLYDDIIKQIKKAGDMLRGVSAGEADIYNKEGISNFVTEYDKKVQRLLVQEMKELIPDAAFLAEEDDMQQQMGDGYCFIIDPIDGTTNFIFNYKNSCISVGLAQHGEMIFGAVYNPYTEEMYTAVKGEGARLNGRNIKCTEKGLEDSVAAFGCARYNSDDTDRIFAFAKCLYLHSLGIRNCGSAAIDLCRVASGSNGVYAELLLQPWDFAAASLIIREAGGSITQIDGTEITLDSACSVLAGGQSCWEESIHLWKTLI
ncbi:MAG: inositol monophosphatase [Clostridium sp.]|nr:inositol monophosphatase [Clostridium sp.]